jgi:YspA, cpYpsA-related SLOG family
MKLIIAGGRAYQFSGEDLVYLDRIVTLLRAGGFEVDEVVTGGAPGADRCGGWWATSRRIPVKIFKAEWDVQGLAAGPIRNRAMARHVGPGGLCILFPGGKGTSSMKREAGLVGMQILEVDLDYGVEPIPESIGHE